MIRLDGQVAIVTGAGAGIGRATASLLAERGAHVVVNDAQAERADTVAEAIRNAGGSAIGQHTPVGTVGAAQEIVGAALRSFGKVDILVNNAGISRPASFGEDSDDDIELVLKVNLREPYSLMREVWPVMREQGYGRILNTASNAALGIGFSGAYAVSKAGIIGLTKDAGLSGKPHGIQVNAIFPSAHTELLNNHPDPDFRKWYQESFDARYVAAASVFFVSPANPHTAELFFVGGGHVSRAALLETAGILDRDLTPEIVSDNLDRIMSLETTTPLVAQADHSAIYARLFPRLDNSTPADAGAGTQAR